MSNTMQTKRQLYLFVIRLGGGGGGGEGGHAPRTLFLHDNVDTLIIEKLSPQWCHLWSKLKNN